MTGITQKIPNFIGGISQQPDELKPEGSLREALNVIPDVTDGLRKRSGSRLVNPLATTDDEQASERGTWFAFNYADNEKYIGKINFDGQVNIFNCADGFPIPCFYSEYDASDEQAPENNPSLGYPDCNLPEYTSTRLAYNNKKRVYDEANGVYNNILNQINQSSPMKTWYSVTQSGPNLIMNEGWFVAYGGGQIIRPNESQVVAAGYTGFRRGSRRIREEDVIVDGVNRGNGEIYEVLANDVSAVAPELQAQLQAQRVVVDAAKTEMDAAFVLFANQAAACGYTSGQLRGIPTVKGVIPSYVVPEYLKHDQQGALRTKVIGNRVFIVNPTAVTSMSESSGLGKRPRENFIEVIAAAQNQDYSLELVAEDTDVQPYSVPTQLKVQNSKFKDSDRTCPLSVFNKEETFSAGDEGVVNKSGEGTNLTVSLTVNGQPNQHGNGNSDSDFECRYTVSAIIPPGGSATGWEVGDSVTCTGNQGDKYIVHIAEAEVQFTGEGELIAVDNTGDGAVSPTTILNNIKSSIEAKDSGFDCKIIGNGIWVTHADLEYVWRFAARNKALMTVTTDQVTSITQLPTQCRAGYTVQVTNTETADDDYYAAFKTTESGIDGPGAWVETIKWGLARYINPNTMPHVISRTLEGFFRVGPIDWEPRLVGDNKTNPKPGFITNKGIDKTIENIVLFNNRLCLLSGDTITCSRPGDYYNFWHASALTIADSDPVDISCGSTSSSQNAVLFDAIEIGQGLVCFSGGEQYVLASGTEAFTPSTAKFSRVGTYRYTGYADYTKEVNGAPVFSLGTSVGFLADSGLNSRLLEMFNIGQTAEASVNELTKPVSKMIPYGINQLADSKDNNLIVLGKFDNRELWVYRYFDNDKNRVQSAWFKWTLPAPLVFHCIMDDVYWSVSYSRSDSVVNEDKEAIVSLQRIDLKDELATAFVSDKFIPSTAAGEQDARLDNDVPYQAHLDNYRIAQPSEFTVYDHFATVNPDTGEYGGVQTYFRAPIIHYRDLADAGRLVAYMLSPTIFQKESEFYGPDEEYYFVKIGSAIPVRIEEDTHGTWFVMDGDWSDTRMMFGYTYDMEVKLPTIYPSKTQQTSRGPVTNRDTRAYLNLHRLKINFGQVGVFETTLKVKGRNDYTELFECKTMDDYPANEVAFDQTKTQVMPVYSKNTDTQIIVKSQHPSPCTIHSMEWEGDYAPKWYRNA